MGMFTMKVLKDPNRLFTESQHVRQIYFFMDRLCSGLVDTRETKENDQCVESSMLVLYWKARVQYD